MKCAATCVWVVKKGKRQGIIRGSMKTQKDFELKKLFFFYSCELVEPLCDYCRMEKDHHYSIYVKTAQENSQTQIAKKFLRNFLSKLFFKSKKNFFGEKTWRKSVDAGIFSRFKHDF